MSTDEKRVTEREAVRRERKAFVLGVTKAGMLYEPSPEAWAERAKQMFALPTVTRPRVVKDSESVTSVEWSVIDGALRMRYTPRSGWMRWCGFKESSTAAPLPHRVALWADLLANPTETVEVGDDD